MKFIAQIIIINIYVMKILEANVCIGHNTSSCKNARISTCQSAFILKGNLLIQCNQVGNDCIEGSSCDSPFSKIETMCQKVIYSQSDCNKVTNSEDCDKSMINDRFEGCRKCHWDDACKVSEIKCDFNKLKLQNYGRKRKFK
jgi:hypothetical protein